jgi:hypothetical protein
MVTLKKLKEINKLYFIRSEVDDFKVVKSKKNKEFLLGRRFVTYLGLKSRYFLLGFNKKYQFNLMNSTNVDTMKEINIYLKNH